MSAPIPPPYVVGKAITAAWLTLVSEWMTDAGSWQSFTPTLTGATTDPNLGTGPNGAKRLAKYMQLGDYVEYQVLLLWATTGSVSQGSGNYSVSLPVAAAAGLGASGDPLTEIGTGTVQANGNQSTISVLVSSAGNLSFRYIDSGGVNGTAHSVGSGAPAAFGAGDWIRFTCRYEAA